ncbi:DDE-type integrase/transposase/recombinase [Spinactinospora alkalitolerans]|uniref:DDE-type integrase/transposase/recombinase n=1 Tax=Spinactinospora alkalitolerans TaxID=687207 RepID=UPI0035E44083
MFSRRIVGWAMAGHMRTALVCDALAMAVAARRPSPGLVHHSGKGSQSGRNRSSRHWLPGPMVDVRSGLRQVSSNRGLCGVCC